MESVGWIDHLFFVTLSFILLHAVLRQQPELSNNTLSTNEKISLYWGQCFFFAAIAAIAMLIWYFQARPFAELGFRWPTVTDRAVWISLSIAFLILWSADTGFKLFPKEKMRQTSLDWRTNYSNMPANKIEVVHALILSVCAGVSEEIVFRGFFINYFVAILGGKWEQFIAAPFEQWTFVFAIFIPAIIFGVSHLYQGWRSVAKIIVMSGFFGLIYVFSQSLLIVVIIHILVNAFSYLLAPWVLRQTDG